MKFTVALEKWESAETAARWHPHIGWFEPRLDPEAVLELKRLGRDD